MSDIKAGGAYIEVFAKEVLGPGLAAAKKKLTSFAKTVGTLGATALAGGASLAAPLIAAVGQYTSIGSELADVNARTGASVEMLSALGHAAMLAGGSLADVQAGYKGMAKLAGQAAAGSKQAAKTLADLGISTQAFLAASPDQRMRLIADGLSRIKDPGLQAAAAMKALGRGGLALLPALKEGSAGLDAMAKKAASLGLVFTDEEVARADRLGDSIDTVKKQVGALFFQIGDALAPVLQPIIDGVSTLLGWVINIIDKNPVLVTTLAAVAAVLIGVGVALITVAGAATLLSFAITGLTTAFTICWAVIGFILSPLGLIILLVAAVSAALIGGAAYFLFYTQTGQAALNTLANAFGWLLQTVKTTFGGIFDAMAAGNLALAGQIAMQGLYVVWLQGMAMLKGLWEDLKLYVFQTMIAIAQFVADKLLATIGPVLKVADSVMGTDFAGGINKAKAGLSALSKGAEANRDRNVANALTDVAKAQKELVRLTGQAAAERKAQDDKRKAKAPVFDPVSNNPVTAPGGHAIGTFSGTVAHLLGRSAPMEAAERTADAAEESRDLLQDMEDDLSAIRDSGGIAFV